MSLLLVTILSIVKLKDRVVILNCDESNIELSLHDTLGDDYFNVYDYRRLDIGDFHILYLHEGVTQELPVFTGTDSDKIMQIIDYLSQYDFELNQPNPNLIPARGGNCQAFAIVFKKLCDNCNIMCEIITDDSEATHVYNRVYTDTGIYNIDTIKRTINEVK